MAASTEQSELVAEEMQLRKELSMARQELVNKKHTLEILQKERDAFKSQLPDALMQQKKDIDAEIAELRSQLKDAKGGVIVPPETNRVGSYAGLAASPGKPAAAGWGALINDAKSTPLPSSSSVGRGVYARLLNYLLCLLSCESLSHTASTRIAGYSVKTNGLQRAAAAAAVEPSGTVRQPAHIRVECSA